MEDLMRIIDDYLDIGECYSITDRGTDYIIVRDLETDEEIRIDFSGKKH